MFSVTHGKRAMHQTIGAFLPDVHINAGSKFLVIYPYLVICEI